MTRFDMIAFILAAGCVGPVVARDIRIEVSNPLSEDRKGEIVEIPISSLKLKGDKFRITDKDGKEVVSQLTYDGKLIFPVEIESLGKVVYTIAEGAISRNYPSYVYGRQFPERLDDLAWENDRSAYRAYGPALQRTGERAYGFDIWSKSVPYPILEQRFYDQVKRNISFHVDHGNGLDDYSVGPTLGGGTPAFLDENGEIIYPYCYKEYEVLDNGPLRFTARLVYNPVEVDGEQVTESRLISLDKGSWLNRTDISYEGLKNAKPVVQGIVVHSNNPKAYTISKEGKYVAYQDLTEHADRGNGEVYVGIYSPEAKDFRFMPKTDVKGVEGHLTALTEALPGKMITYWWGSGWSKGGVKGANDWNSKMDQTSRHLAHPLEVKIAK